MVMSATWIAIKWGSDGVKTWLSRFAGAMFTTPPVQAGSSTWSASTGGGPLGGGLLEDGALEDGALEDGALEDGALGDGALGDGALGDGALEGGPPLEVALLGTILGLEALGVPVDAATGCDPPMNPTATSPPTRAAMADIKPAVAVMTPGRDFQNRSLCLCATVTTTTHVGSR
jgi:hypothetical protein